MTHTPLNVHVYWDERLTTHNMQRILQPNNTQNRRDSDINPRKDKWRTINRSKKIMWKSTNWRPHCRKVTPHIMRTKYQGGNMSCETYHDRNRNCVTSSKPVSDQPILHVWHVQNASCAASAFLFLLHKPEKRNEPRDTKNIQYRNLENNNETNQEPTI